VADGFGLIHSDNNMKRLPLSSLRRALLPGILALALVPCARAANLGNIWLLGDSITYGAGHAGGYRDPLCRDLTARGCTFKFVGTLTSNSTQLLSEAGQTHHDGHSGYTIADATDISGKPRRGLYQSVDSWCRELARPNLILLMIGTNDLNIDYRIDTAPHRLDLLVTRLFGHYPDARLLIATLPDAEQNNRYRHGATENYAMAVRDYNAGIAAVVTKHRAMGQAVSLVPMHPALTLADLRDGLHPKAEGYAKMAKVWADAVLASAGLTARRQTKER